MTAPPNHPKPPTWSAWKAQNGGKGWYWRAPLTIEWALEWFVYRLRSLALFDLLELAGRYTVLVIAIFWVLEAGDRAKERHYRAWDQPRRGGERVTHPRPVRDCSGNSRTGCCRRVSQSLRPYANPSHNPAFRPYCGGISLSQ